VHKHSNEVFKCVQNFTNSSENQQKNLIFPFLCLQTFLMISISISLDVLPRQCSSLQKQGSVQHPAFRVYNFTQPRKMTVKIMRKINSFPLRCGENCRGNTPGRSYKGNYSRKRDEKKTNFHTKYKLRKTKAHKSAITKLIFILFSQFIYRCCCCIACTRAKCVWS
jgi:hypothetical protein